MVSRLSSRGGAQGGGQQAQQGQQGGGQRGGGWGQGGQGGGQGGWGGQGGGQQQDQRQQVQEAIQPRESVRGAFSGGVGQQTETIQNGDYGETSQGGGGAWGQGGAQGGQQGGGQAGSWGGSGGGQNGAQQREEPPFDGGQQASEAPKPSRSRKKAETAAPAAAPSEPGNMDLIAIGVREKVLLAVLAASPDDTMEDIIDVADDMVSYILTGDKPAA